MAITRRLTLEERLRPLPIEDRQLLARGQNAKIRLAEAKEAAREQRIILRAMVRSLRIRGVPSQTIAMALEMSKAWVTRLGR